MTAWYWVAYNILESEHGCSVGSGTIEIELENAPRDVSEILKLADRITDISHDKGVLLGRYVQVLSWSRMGD